MGAAPPRMSTWERGLVPSVAPWVAGPRICVLHPRVNQWDSPVLARASIQVLQDCTVMWGSLQSQNSDTPWGDLVHSVDILRSLVWPIMGCTPPSAPPSYSLLPSTVYVSSMRSRAKSKRWLCPLLMLFLLFYCHLPSFHPLPEQLN